MNQVSGNKILLAIIAVLIITNIVMLVLFLRMKKPEAATTKKLGFTEKLKNEVGFTSEQMAVFEPRKKAFWKTMRERFEDMKKTKEAFYYQLYDPSIKDSVIESKAEVIGKQQKELDLFVIRHFKEVRALCTPQQLPKYDSLVPALIERLTARPR
jgi:protein CpxP